MNRDAIVLVTGGRDFRDVALFVRTMNALYERLQFGTVVHGACATGADAMVRPWVLGRVSTRGFGPMIIRPFPADWKTHVCRVDSRCRSRSTCRAAGPVRNQLMVDRACPGHCVAFHGGTGTEDCVARARKAGAEILVAA